MAAEHENDSAAARRKDDPLNPFGPRRFRRSGTGLEFDRVCFFCDAVFAIALTIIVVGLDAPSVADGDTAALLEKLGDAAPSIIIFFVAFVVIGRYWIANHTFMAAMDEVDAMFIGVTLLYLATIAFLPFPATVLGLNEDNAIAVVLFACGLAAASTLETVQLIVAQRHRLLRAEMTPEGYRWSLIGSWSPVVTMAISIPVAFISPLLGVLCWFLASPIGIVLDRRRPAQLVEAGETPTG